MSIPKTIKHGKLPTTAGVYLFKDKKGKVVYVGKATNLKSRVASYWKSIDEQSSIPRNRGLGRTIDEMLHEVARIDWVTTDSVIEALILEANLIKKYMPAYNVKEKDDKSFLYVVITKEQWPKVQLMRGNELAQRRHPERSEGSRTNVRSSHAREILRSAGASLRMTDNGVMRVFGPYTSASSIRAALDLIRKWFPWSTCRPARNPSQPPLTLRGGDRSVPPLKVRGGRGSYEPRPCFDYHIGRCPGVCVGVITRVEYMKNIRNVILMLEGKKTRVLKNVEYEMKRAAKEERFEEAEKLRRKLFALQHIRDVAVLRKDAVHDRHLERSAKHEVEGSHTVHGKRSLHSPRGSVEMTESFINILGRIEGYDISNISGTSAVGSMVVFQNGEPAKNEYRKFKIKTVHGINDVAMMREVLERRFKYVNIKSWGTPDLIVIDGGWGQVNVAREVVRQYGIHIPIIGIAKGFDRKQDQPIFQKTNPDLARIVEKHKDLLLRVRDEAHRFAITYHRKLRRMTLQDGASRFLTKVP